MRSAIRKLLLIFVSVSLLSFSGCSSETTGSDSSVPVSVSEIVVTTEDTSVSDEFSDEISIDSSAEESIDSVDSSEEDSSASSEPSENPSSETSMLSDPSEDPSDETSLSVNPSDETADETSAPSIPEDVDFVVHFIDVGQGDAALIVCGGEAMMIDGGSSDKSELIYSYLKKNGITDLKYVVATHPDDDHMGGLSGALNFATAERAFCSVTEYAGWAFENFRKYLTKQIVEIEVPSSGTVLTLGSAEITVLAPIETLEEVNNNSIVLRIVYGNTSFLFTGDAEFSEESTILTSGREIKSDVLKVGHHGSEYSSSTTFLKEVSPSVAVISCGKGNDYGFPKQRVLDSLQKQDVQLFRTDLCGDILIYSDGETLYVSPEKALSDDPFVAPEPMEIDPADIPDCDYVVNKSSRKFHLPTCESVAKMSEKNKWCYEGDRETLIAEGYEPCQMCNP